MSWLYLIIAGFFEVFWAVGLKFTHGFTNLFASVLTVTGMVASFYFLAAAMKTIPLGTAYACWTGIGTVGTVICGFILFGEQLSVLKVCCILLIVSGIVGLRIMH
ncbi:MAG: quaternary ammonium compound efflux SMR transporter SugE [Succinivibrio sp.]|nr:quaternary ammonium compound efflux SMR transporter SugE [Succinivibrio sp.]